MMMEMIRDDLAALNIRQEVFFSEQSLHDGRRGDGDGRGSAEGGPCL